MIRTLSLWILKHSIAGHPSAFGSFFFLGPHPQHMKVPRLGVKSKLWPPADATAAAMQDLSHVCDPHHSSRVTLDP